MSDIEDPVDLPDDGGDDLFGDGDDDDQLLSDIEAPSDRDDLASDKEDEDTHDRQDREVEEETQYRPKLVQDLPLYRHRIPRSKDGSLQTLKVPKFFKLNPREYKPDSWEPSEWDLTNANAEKPLPSVMFRRDPQTGKMQSNTNVYRWSDGSVTIAIGDEHFEIMSKPLAPPPNKPYNEVQDAHYYAAAAHLTTNSLLIVGHFTEEYTVKPNKDIADHALERLKAQMAGAKKERTDEMIIVTKEDPELAKKQAELAEKERAKAQRRRETAAARVDGAGGRYKGGALSIGDLEGRRSGPGGSRKRGQGGPRRRPEYDSDDDAAPGARRADNYDMDDGFLVDSEEESEEVEDDEEEEPDYDEDEAPKSKKRKSKASKSDVDDEGDDDFDDDAPAQASRHKRRIIDDDDEE